MTSHIIDEDDLCPRCDHRADPHLVVATNEDPLLGGVVLCQVKGCMCFSTWAPQWVGRDDVRIPDDDELNTMRLNLQTDNP